MYSIGSLNLLPPQTPPPATASPAPSTSGDGSFGSALKRAQDKNSSLPDDGTQPAKADDSTAKTAQPADAEPSGSSNPASTEGADQTDEAAAAAGTESGKPVQADGVKKPAAGETTGGKKRTDDVDESDGKKSAGTEVVDALTIDSADGATTAVKQTKKAAVKPATVKAAAEPAAAAADGVKPKKVDPSKKTDAKWAGKTGTVDPVAAGKTLKSVAAAADGAAEAVDDGIGPAVDTGADTSDAAGGLVAKVVGQKAFNSKAKGSTGPTDSGNAAANAVAAAEAAGVAATESGADSSTSAAAAPAVGTVTSASGEDTAAASALAADAGTASGRTDPTAQAAPAVKPTPQQQFVEDNHPKIVTGVAGELLPDGGTMQIRLDPPELGTISVTIHMKAGVMSAAFETSNDDSTRMLSHSLSQLKTSLEATGVSVEKMQVQQSPKQEGKGTGDKDSGTEKQQDQQGQAKRDQQRQDLIKRMWAKLAGGDPLDLVA